MGKTFTLTNELRKSVQDKDDMYYPFAYRICNRRHHSMIYQTSEFTDGIDRRKVEVIFKLMSNKYSNDYDLVIDHGEGIIHKFFVEGEDAEGEEFYVIRNNRECLLTKESYIIRKMPKKFHVVRIYIDSKDLIGKLSKRLISDLSKEALEIEREVR